MYRILVVGALLLLPLYVSAEVVITEIMYDPKGTDVEAGSEWIEIRNNGTETIDLTTWVFFENDTNHGITADSVAEILPGDYAVISRDLTAFKNYFTEFSGALFKSSFLLNDGETLAMKRGKTAPVSDSVAYTFEWGGKGDETSLQFIGGSWKFGVPTPGATNASTPAPESDDDKENTKQTVTKPNTGEEQPPSQQTESFAPNGVDDFGIPLTLTVKAGKDRTMTVGAAEFFNAQAYRKTGAQEKNAKYRWNFGNGFMRHGQNILFQYNYPGKYVALVTVEGANDAKAFARFTVTAEEAKVAIPEVNETGITIKNEDKRELNLSLWSLRSGDRYFLLPEDTIVLPGSAVVFPSEVTGLSGGGSIVALVYPNGKDAAVYDKTVGTVSSVVTTASSAMPKTDRAVVSQASAGAEGSVILTDNLQPSAEAILLLPAAAATSKKDIVPWLLGLSTVLVCGLIALYIIRHKVDDSMQVHGITIIDTNADENNSTSPFTFVPGRKELPPKS